MFVGVVAMVAVVTSPTTAECSVVYCSCSCSCIVVPGLYGNEYRKMQHPRPPVVRLATTK